MKGTKEKASVLGGFLILSNLQFKCFVADNDLIFLSISLEFRNNLRGVCKINREHSKKTDRL